MTLSETSFSFPSARKLFKYLGETDAMVELTELSARSLIAAAEQSGSIRDFISAESVKHGVCVNMGEVESFLRHLSRSYIVNVYSSAERFLHGFREEHIALHRKDWSGDADNVDPLTVALRNIANKESEAVELVGSDLVSRFHYYRVVRNWVVHTKESDPPNPWKRYEEITEYSSENKQVFGSGSVPHLPEKLNFDDFILFTRLAKSIAQRLCDISKPDRNHWISNFNFEKLTRFDNNPSRMKSSIARKLVTEYGLDKGTAQWLASEILDSRA